MARFTWSILFLILVAALPNRAEATLDFAKGVHYESDTIDETSAYNTDFDRLLKTSYTVIESEGRNGFASPLLWLNRIYSRKGTERIYAKGGVYISGVIEYGKVYRGDQAGHYIGHVQDVTNGDHVLFFEGMSEEAAQSVLSKLAGAPSAQKTAGPVLRRRSLYSSLFFSAARADDVAPNRFCAKDAPTAAESEKAESLFSKVMACGKGLGKGLWGSTFGLVGGAFKAAGSFLEDPIEAAKHVYGAGKDAWNFLVNIDTYLPKIWDGFKNMPVGDQAEVVCEMLATIGVGAVVNTFTSGVGSASLGLKIAEMTERMAKSGRLKSIVPQLPKLAAVTAKNAEKSAAYEIARASQSKGLAQAYGDMQKTAAAISPSEKKAADAVKALEAYERGNPGKSWSVATDRVNEAYAQLASMQSVQKAASSLASAQKAFNLSKEQNAAINAAIKKIKDFSKKVAKAGGDPKRLAALEDERKALTLYVNGTEKIFRLSAQKVKPPRGGWDPAYDVVKNNQLIKAAEDAKAEALAARSAHAKAVEVHEAAVKAKSPELARQATDTAALGAATGALALCKGIEDVSAKSPTANDGKGANTTQ